MRFLLDAVEVQVNNQLAPIALRRVCFQVFGLFVRHYPSDNLLKYCIESIHADTDF